MKRAEAQKIENIVREFLNNPDVGVTFFKEGITLLTMYGVHKDDLNNIVYLGRFKHYHGRINLWVNSTFFKWFNKGVLDALELMGIDTNKQYYEFRYPEDD